MKTRPISLRSCVCPTPASGERSRPSEIAPASRFRSGRWSIRLRATFVWFAITLLGASAARAVPVPGTDFTPLIRLPGHVLAAPKIATSPPSKGAAGNTATTTAPRLTADSPLTLTIVLNRTDPQGFEDFVRAVQDPASSNFRHYLTPQELAQRFGPTERAYDQVLRYLEAHGFTLVEGSTNRLTLTMRGTRAQVEEAFALNIVDYRLKDRNLFANDTDPALPAEIAAHVQAVVGLSNLARPRPNKDSIDDNLCLQFAIMWCGLEDTKENEECLTTEYLTCLLHMPDSPQGGGNGPGGGGSGNRARELAARAVERWTNAFPPLKAVIPRWIDANGTGQKVALLQFDTFRPSDISNYLALVRLPATHINRVSQVHVNGGAPLGADQVEVLIDIIAVLINARGANIAVYDAPSTTSFQTLFNRMIVDGATVISNSWSYCENQTTLADVQSIDSILAGAAASGISVFNASGDRGSTCLNGSPNTAGVPASSPHATAVGGTSLTLGPLQTYGSETWWNGSAHVPPTGQGGFGVSQFFSRPAYQNGLTASPMRSIPDVAVNADPATGIAICEADGGGCTTGLLYGGTSLAAPTWAAFAALLNHAQGQNLGQFNPLLYPLAATAAFHSGASMGSDFAHVGLGSPNLNQLHVALSGRQVGPVSAALSQVDVDFARAPADGLAERFIVVRLRDAAGNTISGKNVTLSASPGGNVTIGPASGVSNVANGAVVFSIKNTAVQTVVFTATDTTDNIVLQQTVTMGFVVPSAVSAGISAGPTTVNADGVAATIITVTLRDGLNRPTPGKLVTLAQGNGHSLITGPNPSVTDAAGQIQFTATNLVNEVVTYRATDVSDGNLAVPGSAVVTFTNGSGGACGQSLPVPTGLNGYAVTPFATGFQTGALSFSNVNYGGCAGVSTPGFREGSVYLPNFLNGDLFKIGSGGGAVSNANKLATLGPTLGWAVVGKDGRLYATRAGTGGNFNTGIVVELDPNTGAILRTLSANLTCPQGLAVDPLSGDLFFVDVCFGGGSDNPSLFRITNPAGAGPATVVYATLPFTPNGQIVFSPKGSIYVVSGYTQPTPPVVRVSGTNLPGPPTLTQIAGAQSNFWVNIASVGPDGEATMLITLLNNRLKLTDITTNPATAGTELAQDIGGGIIGPDGCLYMPNQNALYRLTDPAGGCGFAPTIALPSLRLTPTAVSPNPLQGTAQTFTAAFLNVNVPAGTPVLFLVTGANPQVRSVPTDANGRAAFSYTAKNTGIDRIVAMGTTNTLVSNTALVTWGAGRHVTALTLNPSPTNGVSGTPVTVQAVLVDTSPVVLRGVAGSPPDTLRGLAKASATALSGLTVMFNVAGASCSGVTNGAGLAVCTLTPTGASGNMTLTAIFVGTAQYTPASASTGFALVTFGGPAPQADLAISKTDGQLNATPGSTLTYTIVASNLGPSAVIGATVVDTLPAILNGSTWTCVPSAGSNCPAGGSGNINVLIDLLAGGSATFLLTAAVDVNATGVLSNTATIAVPGGVIDPVSGNNSATDTDTLIVVAVARQIPTLAGWVYVLLTLCIGWLGARRLRGRLEGNGLR